MNGILNLSRYRALRDQDLYVDMLNDKARLERLKAKRREAIEREEKEREAEEQERKRKERVKDYMLALTTGLCILAVVFTALGMLHG